MSRQKADRGTLQKVLRRLRPYRLLIGLSILLSALSVALYGMFLAIIIPPCRKSRAVAVLVAVSFLLSFAVASISVFAVLSDSMRTILLTVVISAVGALLFPIAPEEEGNHAQ